MSKAKAKGTKWERDVCTFLSVWWPDIDRRVTEGKNDKGDHINGPVNWTIEDKDDPRAPICSQLREAEKESGNAGTRWYALLRKQRRSKLEPGTTARGLAVMRIEDWAQLVAEHEDMIKEIAELKAAIHEL